MTEKKASVWRNVASWLGIALALAALLLGSGFWYDNFWKVPDVAYTVLPSYNLGEQVFGGVVIENRGRATAHEVVISFRDLGTVIQRFNIESDEFWDLREGGEGTQKIALTLHRLASGSSLTIYFLTSEMAQMEELVAVTFEEGRGHPASEVSMAATLSSALVAIIAAVSGFLLAGAVGRLRSKEVVVAATGEIKSIEKGVLVDAAQEGWTPTGLRIEDGNLLFVSARGHVTYDATRERIDADGKPRQQIAGPNAVLPGAPYGSLIGKIGTEGVPFLIGSRYSTYVESSGELLLCVNDDRGAYGDNTGRFRLTVAIRDIWSPM